MKKLLNGLLVAAAVVLLTGIVGCENGSSSSSSSSSSSLSDGRDIISFVINDKAGAIDAKRDRISIVLPAQTDLTGLTPEITVSSGAKVTPESGVAADFSGETTYTVIAANGAARPYIVSVTTDNVLTGLRITAWPQTVYDLNELFNPAGLVVVGIYSDGSVKEVYDYELSAVSTADAGEKTVTVTVETKTAAFKLLVKDPNGGLALTIELQHDGKDAVIYGLPAKTGETDFILSWTGRPDEGNLTLPTEIVLSTSGYDSYIWYVDESPYYTNVFNNTDNIIVLKAEDFTLERPHTITFVGGIDGFRYSRTLTFTVEK